jgi:hypothetical protein
VEEIQFRQLNMQKKSLISSARVHWQAKMQWHKSLLGLALNLHPDLQQVFATSKLRSRG